MGGLGRGVPDSGPVTITSVSACAVSGTSSLIALMTPQKSAWDAWHRRPWVPQLPPDARLRLLASTPSTQAGATPARRRVEAEATSCAARLFRLCSLMR